MKKSSNATNWHSQSDTKSPVSNHTTFISEISKHQYYKSQRQLRGILVVDKSKKLEDYMNSNESLNFTEKLNRYMIEDKISNYIERKQSNQQIHSFTPNIKSFDQSEQMKSILNYLSYCNKNSLSKSQSKLIFDDKKTENKLKLTHRKNYTQSLKNTGFNLKQLDQQQNFKYDLAKSFSKNRLNLIQLKKKGEKRKSRDVEIQDLEALKKIQSFDFRDEKPNFSQFIKNNPIKKQEFLIGRDFGSQKDLNNGRNQVEIIKHQNQIALLMLQSKKIQTLRSAQQIVTNHIKKQDQKFEDLMTNVNKQIMNF